MRVITKLAAAGLAVAASIAVAPASAGAAPGGAGFGTEALPLVEPVQYRERSPLGQRETLFGTHALRRPGSLLRPYSYRVGPHYQPPSVVYEPPAVTYRPPTTPDRIGCAPRTRAWYDRCAARYRSFDPNSGTYVTYSGQERFCRCP
jgi:hypothetical protein